MSDRGREALSAAVKALPTSPRKALQVFSIALGSDPTMADALLGRVAAGDHSLETLKALSTHSRNLGAHLRHLGKGPRELGACLDVEAIRLDIVDPVSAQAAYAVALINAGKYEAAHSHLNTVPDRPEVAYVRAVLNRRTERWPDVLTALTGCERWMNTVLRRAASLLEAEAAANLGLFDRAAAAAQRANTSDEAADPDPINRDAQFCLALLARARGQEEQAMMLLTEIRVAWPGFAGARTALEDRTYGFRVTDAAVIDTRSDPWDSTTQRTQEMDLAERQAKLLSDAEATLNKQIGLDEVKNQVHKLRSHVKVNKVRVERGFEPIMRSHHLIFSGPPGTGKTTIAQVVANIYCGLGVLKTTKFREAKRADFVGETLGSTAIKTNKLIDDALDGVLFIDEAYALIQTGLSGGDAFGREAVDTLLARMEDERDRLMVIIAGYENEIDRFLTANEGLLGRFPRRLRFQSYNSAELAGIAAAIAGAKDSTIVPAGIDTLERVCNALTLLDVVVGGDDDKEIRRVISAQEDSGALGPTEVRRRFLDVLGNGRFIRNVVEASFEEQMHRIADEVDGLDGSAIDEAITTLVEKDVSAALRTVLSTMAPGKIDAAALIEATGPR